MLTVVVDSHENLDQPPFGFVIDYMTYGGIYRDVYLEIKNPIYIEDIFVKPAFVNPVVTEGMRTEEIAAVCRDGILTSELTFSQEANEAMQRGEVGIRQLVEDTVVLEAPIATSSLRAQVSEIALWDVESPKVYEVVTQLLYQDQVVDEKKTTVGFRDAAFRKDGFYLNGRKVKIRGLNRHQSYAYVGYAMPESMQRLDAKILKEEIGWNRNTTYTVIKKCIEKGAVERFEPKFRCRALISKKDAQEYETEELIDRMFEGSKKNFFAAMLSENSLTAEELEQLKDMVNQMK